MVHLSSNTLNVDETEGQSSKELNCAPAEAVFDVLIACLVDKEIPFRHKVLRLSKTSTNNEIYLSISTVTRLLSAANQLNIYISVHLGFPQPLPSVENESDKMASTSYADTRSRLTKENLYMVIALWMERFPVEGEKNDPTFESYKKVGAVLVLPNDMSYAVDCTRHGVHAVARLLMAHPSILEDCKVFVSRKPCSFCTKLLVQSKIKRVYYLPIEPEYVLLPVEDFKTEGLCVDNLFKVSSIGETVFVLKAGEEVLNDLEKRKPVTSTKIRRKKQKKLMNAYWNENWMLEAEKNLPWTGFDDNMQKQVRSYFKGMMKWMATILVGSGNMEKGCKFLTKSCRSEALPLPFDPEKNKAERKQAKHLIRFAKFLAERSDDPKTGVGAIIINKEKKIIGLGWNGYPTKALYGEFPRPSDKDGAKKNKKYPYIIHAEQNALLRRNTENIEGGTLVVTKTPCNECTPLLEMQKIKTFVLGGKLEDQTKASLDYKQFCKKVRTGALCCFELTDNADTDNSEPASKKKKTINMSK